MPIKSSWSHVVCKIYKHDLTHRYKRSWTFNCNVARPKPQALSKRLVAEKGRATMTFTVGVDGDGSAPYSVEVFRTALILSADQGLFLTSSKPRRDAMCFSYVVLRFTTPRWPENGRDALELFFTNSHSEALDWALPKMPLERLNPLDRSCKDQIWNCTTSFVDFGSAVSKGLRLQHVSPVSSIADVVLALKGAKKKKKKKTIPKRKRPWKISKPIMVNNHTWTASNTRILCETALACVVAVLSIFVILYGCVKILPYLFDGVGYGLGAIISLVSGTVSCVGDYAASMTRGQIWFERVVPASLVLSAVANLKSMPIWRNRSTEERFFLLAVVIQAMVFNTEISSWKGNLFWHLALAFSVQRWVLPTARRRQDRLVKAGVFGALAGASSLLPHMMMETAVGGLCHWLQIFAIFVNAFHFIRACHHWQIRSDWILRPVVCLALAYVICSFELCFVLPLFVVSLSALLRIMRTSHRHHDRNNTY